MVLRAKPKAWLELEVSLFTGTGDVLWRGSRLRVDFRKALITDRSE